MRSTIHILAAGLAVLCAGFGAAQAQPEYFGPGPRYYGPPPGYREAPPPPPPGYYREAQPRYEVQPGYYGGGGNPDQPIYQRDNFGNPEVWFRPIYTPYGPRCRQQGYTVQDGYCKRYRGY